MLSGLAICLSLMMAAFWATGFFWGLLCLAGGVVVLYATMIAYALAFGDENVLDDFSPRKKG